MILRLTAVTVMLGIIVSLADAQVSRGNARSQRGPGGDTGVYVIHSPEPPAAPVRPVADATARTPAARRASPQSMPTFALRAQPIQLATIIPCRLGFPTVLIFKEPIEEVLLGEQEQFSAEVFPTAASGQTWAIGLKPTAAGGVSGLVVITRSGYYRFVLQESIEVNPAMTVEVPLPGEATTQDPMLGITETLLRIARGEMPPPVNASRRVFESPRTLRASAFMKVEVIGGAYYRGFTCLILQVTNPTNDAAVPLTRESFMQEGVFGVGVDEENLVKGPDNRNYLRPGDSTRIYVVFHPEFGDKLLFEGDAPPTGGR